MHWLLQVPGQPAAVIDKPLVRIGSDPGSDVYLAHPGLAATHALVHCGNQCLWLEAVGHPVHVNGRRIRSKALIRPGDDLHFGSLPARLQSANAPDLDVDSGAGTGTVNFQGRVVLRALTGADAGRAYALMNSLCLGRSVLSEIRIDDLALAERQLLVQRQGNHIVVKNLSPVLEMRVDGWSCVETKLLPGSQLCIEQHRYVLEAPCLEMASVDEPVPEPEASPLAVPAQLPATAPFFSKTQWLLLASAIILSGLITLLLTLSP